MYVDNSYWNKFYSSNGVHYPSSFAIYLASIAKKDHTLVEFGCGNGRDSAFLANFYNKSIAIDGSKLAIDRNKTTYDSTHINFVNLELAEIQQLKLNVEEPKTFYSRFFQHSITEVDESIQLEYINKVSSVGNICAFEFRNSDDETESHIFVDHYRRFVRHEDFLHKVTSIGYRIVYEFSGKGVAPFKNEDPFISRVIAEKK